MSKLLNAVRRINKRTAVAVAVIAAAIVVPATLFAWGPDRPTYTIDHPADHITFNSITNNPNIGDERNFVGIREAGTNTTWSDDMTVQPGKEYVVRMYVHNNAASSLNKVAENVTAKFNLPTNTAKSLQINGFLNSSNATPQEVYDHAVMKSDQNFNLSYQAGTLKYHNNASGAQGFTIPESVFTSAGAKLGYDKMDGKIPGCFQYSGYLTFTVKPQFATPPAPNFNLNKEVRKAGDKTFVESIEAKPGDKLNYRITVNNSGAAQLNNFNLKDTLPKGVTNVPGTVRIMNANNPGGAYIQDGDKLFSSGVNIGSYTAGSNAIVIFDATVGNNETLPTCGPNKLTNSASVQPEGQNPKTDTADVTVPKECQPEAEYKCEGLKVDKIEPTKFKFTTSVATKNATFKKVTYVIRNEQGVEVDRKDSPEKTYDYTQTNPGKYSVEAIVTVTVNGQDKIAPGDCKGSFEVEKPVVPEYKCEGLTVTPINRTNFKFETKYTAKNATLKSIEYVIRDEAGNETRQTNAEYSQTKPGKYTVEAIVTVTVDGQDKRAPGDCKKQFEVVKENTPAIAIEKKVDGVEHKAVGVNQEFTYQVTVTNTGDVDLANAEVTDNAPTGVTFLKASVGSITGNTWNYTIPSLKAGESKDFTITAKVPAYLAGKIVNTVCVNAPEVPGNPDDCDDASVEVPPTPVVPPTTPEKPVTPPATPAELPKTGTSDGIVALLGAGSLIAAVGYYIASRRALGA